MVTVGILGAGSWGTALTSVLVENGFSGTIWARRQELVDEMRKERINTAYLPGFTISDEIEATSSIREAVFGKQVIIIAVPSHSVRSVVIEARNWLGQDAIIVSASKGFEPGSGKRMSQIIAEEIRVHSNIAVLSGPSHAEEVIKKYPTTVVVASSNQIVSEKVGELLGNSYFRVCTSLDVVGVEIGGALKNIIAIAAGLVDGIGFGDNTKAAIITKGLAEIIRLGKKMGANPITFIGLTGIGDLVVTCISKHSRNWKAGYELGQGKGIDVVLKEMGMIVEGINATQATYNLSRKYHVSMPLTEELFKVLFEQKDPKMGMLDFMNQEMSDEVDGIF